MSQNTEVTFNNESEMTDHATGLESDGTNRHIRRRGLTVFLLHLLEEESIIFQRSSGIFFSTSLMREKDEPREQIIPF